MIIVIYASDELKFENNKKELMTLGYSAEQILFANSKQVTRLDIIKKHSQVWLLFLDHDCILTLAQAQVLNKIVEGLKANSGNQVVTGLYVDSPQSVVLQRAHNWIANTWLACSYDFQFEYPFLLGGIFLIYSNKAHFENDLPVGIWGAEDKYLALVLKKAGFLFQHNPELKVDHDTTKSFKHFLKRAYLHGINDVRYFTQYPQQGSNFLYWLRKIDYSDVRLVFLVALHFFVQRGARIFQTLRQLNK